MTRTSAAQFSLMACGAMMIVSSINDLLPGVNGTRLSLDIRSTNLTLARRESAQTGYSTFRDASRDRHRLHLRTSPERDTG